MARTPRATAASPTRSAVLAASAAEGSNIGYAIQTPDLVETRVGTRKVMLPSRITGNESAATMNLIYHTTLSSLQTNCSGMGAINRMTGLCAVMGQDAIGSTIISACNGLINEALKDPAKMRVHAYHKISGANVGADSLMSRDAPIILKPVGSAVESMAGGDRRGNGIKFVSVVVHIDLKPVLEKDVTVTFDSFFELPQGREEILDGTGSVITAHTWLGPGDFTDMSVEDFKTLCLDKTRQHGAADLVESAFGAASASLTYGDKEEKIRDMVLTEAEPFLCEIVHKASCPHSACRPADLVRAVKQEYRDEQGNFSTVDCTEYGRRLMAALGAQNGRPHIPLDFDIVGIAYQNCNKDIRSQMELDSDMHTRTHRREPIPQMAALTQWIVEAKKAEIKIKNTSDIARSSVASAIESTHLTMANMGVPGYSEASALAASAAVHDKTEVFAAPAIPRGSQAENTLAAYSCPPFVWNHLKCLGCGSEDHPWSRTRNGTRVILCPKKDVPGVHDTYMKNLPLLRDMLRTRKRTYGDLRGGAPGRGFGGRSPNRERTFRGFSNLSGADRDDLVNTLSSNAAFRDDMSKRFRAANDGAGPPTGRDQNGANTNQGHDIPWASFMIKVFIANDMRIPRLPAPIDGDLAHSSFLVGNPNGTNRFIGLRCCLDTGAGINVAQLEFMSKIALLNPECVSKIYTCKNAHGYNEYTPINLSGIVSEDTEGLTTTELPVVFELYTAYKNLTTQRPCTLLFGTGKGVSINAIVGNPFFRTTDAIIDAGSSILRVPKWVKRNGGPANFKIEWGPPALTAPAAMSAPGPIQYSRTHLALTKDVVHVLQTYAPDCGFLKVAAGLSKALSAESNTSASVHWPAAPSEKTKISVQVAEGCAITPADTLSRSSPTPRGVLKKAKIQWKANIDSSRDDGMGGYETMQPQPAFTGATTGAGSLVDTNTEGARAYAPSEFPALAATPAAQNGLPSTLLADGMQPEEFSDDDVNLFASCDEDGHVSNVEGSS